MGSATSKPWYGRGSLARAHQIGSSKISNRRLKALNADPKLRRLKIRRQHFDHAICMWVKDIETSDGAFSINALERTFVHNDLPTNHTLVRLVMEELQRVGLFTKIRAAVVYTLPFVIDRCPSSSAGDEKIEPEGASDVRNAFATAGGGGGARSDSDGEKGNSSSQQYNVATSARQSLADSFQLTRTCSLAVNTGLDTKFGRRVA